MISCTGSGRPRSADHLPSELRGTCRRSSRPIWYRSRRDAGRRRSEVKASLSAEASTTCPRPGSPEPVCFVMVLRFLTRRTPDHLLPRATADDDIDARMPRQGLAATISVIISRARRGTGSWVLLWLGDVGPKEVCAHR